MLNANLPSSIAKYGSELSTTTLFGSSRDFREIHSDNRFTVALFKKLFFPHDYVDLKTDSLKTLLGGGGCRQHNAKLAHPENNGLLVEIFPENY